jgi:hypothetical protein
MFSLKTERIRLRGFFSGLMPFFFSAMTVCIPSCTYYYQTVYIPEYMSYDELRSSFKITGPRNLSVPGKIRAMNQWLFISEIGTGIHVFDNSNPISPVNTLFLNIPGNTDLEVSGDILYADSYTDLLALDISRLGETSPSVSLKYRLPDVLYLDVYRRYLGESNPYQKKVKIDKSRGVVVNVLRDKEMKTTFNPFFFYAPSSFDTYFLNGNGQSPVASDNTGYDSLFSVKGDLLYTVRGSVIGIYSIKESDKPVFLRNIPLEFHVETVYSANGKLFIVSLAELHVYSLSDPLQPVNMTTFEIPDAYEQFACSDGYAFVLLKEWQWTSGSILAIKFPADGKPRVVKEYEMSNLSDIVTDGSRLYICARKEGVKMFDASNPLSLRLIDQMNGGDSRHAVIHRRILTVTGPGGLTQYDISSGGFRLLSSISAERKKSGDIQ